MEMTNFSVSDSQHSPRRGHPFFISSVDFADATVLSVHGELDHQSAPQLHEAVGYAVFAMFDGLVIDLSGTSFLSSAGMAVLDHARQRCEDVSGAVAVVAQGPATARPLQLSGLTRNIPVVDSVEAALQGIREARSKEQPTDAGELCS